jgi:hypothetical protein
MLALRTFLRDKGWFEERGIAPPNLADYLIWWRSAPWRTSYRWMPTTGS